MRVGRLREPESDVELSQAEVRWAKIARPRGAEF